MQSIFQNSYRIFPVLLSLFILASVLQAASGSSRGSDTSEKTYLFPGTGFFVKNRKPYEPQEAKRWFNEADGHQKKGDLGKALSLYEKFAKRRSDTQIQVRGENDLSGPNLSLGQQA